MGGNSGDSLLLPRGHVPLSSAVHVALAHCGVAAWLQLPDL